MADPLSIFGAAVAGIDAAKYLLKVIQALDDIRGSDKDYIAFDHQLRSLADSLLLAATFAKSIDNEEGRVAVFSAIQPCSNEVREALERIDGFNPFSKGDRKQRMLLKVRWYGSRKEEAEKYRQKIERLSVQLILAIVLCQFNYSNRRVPHVATEETGSTLDTMKTSLESLHEAAGLNRSELESLIFLVEQNRPALIELLQSVTSIAESSDKQISQVSALMTLIERQSSSLASLSVDVGQLISRQNSLERLLKDCFILLRRLGAVDDLTATTLAVISRDNGISPTSISFTQAFRSGVKDLVRRVSVSWNTSWKGLTGYFFTPQPGRSLPSLLVVLSLDGQPIKIPPEYPTTLEAVREYILLHFKHRKELSGRRFIQSGRYELSGRDSGQAFTDADDWDRHLLQSADLVMVEVEMGVILSRRTEPTIGECPACGTVYRNHRAEDAWVECVNKYCGARYHISKVDDLDSENRFEEIADAEVDLESSSEATQPKPLAPPPVDPQDTAQPDNSSTAPAIGQKRSASSAGLLDLRNDLKRIRKIHVMQVSVLLKELGKLDPNTAPPDMKIEGNDWFAVFQNHEAKQSLGMRLVHSFEHKSPVACARFSPDGRYLATGCNYTAQIYDTMTGKRTCTLMHGNSSQSGDRYIRDLRFTFEGDYLVTATEDGIIRIWEHRLRRIHAKFTGHRQAVYSLDISCDGSLLASGSGDRTVRIWSLADGSYKELFASDFDSHVDHTITSVTFSPDGRLVVAGSVDAIVRVWDTATGALLAQLRGHTDSVYSVAFTPDGRGIISGSFDSTVKCWDVQAAILPTRGGEEGKSCRTTYTGPSNYVFNVAVSEDGRWIMGGSKDCKAWLWDMKTGTTQFLLAAHTEIVIAVDFCPKTSLFVTGSCDCIARIWDYRHV